MFSFNGDFYTDFFFYLVDTTYFYNLHILIIRFMAMNEDRSLSLDKSVKNKDETNASNNSSAQKKGEKSASKSGKSNKKSPTTQGSSQSQNSRRNGHLEKLRR